MVTLSTFAILGAGRSCTARARVFATSSHLCHTGGRVPYGYRRMPERLDPDTGLALPSLGIEPDPETAPVVRRMYRLYLDGVGLRGIAQALNAEGVASPKGAGWSL